MKETFGQYLKELRTQKRLTLTQLAAKLSMDSANLSKVENGKREFDTKRLPKLCKLFQLEIEEMKKELLSEKFAKSVYEKNISTEVFALAKQKTNLFSQKDYQISENVLSLVEERDGLLETKDWRLRDFAYPNSEIRIGTLFSGIGSVEHALQRLGLNHSLVFASDIDPHVKQTYFANYEIGASDWHSDVTQFSAKKYKGKIDILVGGSPCQAFSMVGKRKGLDDIRGTLFYDFARIVSETKPKVFIYENVKGLTNHDGGKTWKIVQDVFNELGYKIKSQILNSKDFGIPQHRERIFCIGFQDHNIDFSFPEKIKLERSMQDFLEDCIDSKYYLREKGVKFVTSSKNKTKRYTQINGEIML